ncbi:hypothetical protein A3Q56_07387, partial [Intoshia linei]
MTNIEEDFNTSSGSECDSEYLIESLTESESDAPEPDISMTGKDGVSIWNTNKIYPNRFSTAPTNKIFDRSNISIENSFRLLFTDIMEIIVNCTNIKIEDTSSKYSRPRDAKLTNSIEMNAYIGILFISGILRGSRTHFFDLWESDGCDFSTFYCYNLELYLGKDDDKSKNEPINVTLRMLKPYWGSGFNVTMDNWFTSIPLEKNKRELAPQFVSTKNRSVFSTISGHLGIITLASYCPKPIRFVNLISTKHDSINFNEE